MKAILRMLALAAVVAAGTVTAAQAFDITELRQTPASAAPGTLQANGFRFVGTYDDSDGEWKMWFNRSAGECVGYTQKGREVKRAKSFKIDRCRNSERGFGDSGYGDRDRYDDQRGDHDRYGDGDVPGWMVGYFRGYNRTYGSDLSLDISRDGTVIATVNGKRVDGEYRRGKLRIGFSKFYVEQDRDGLTTREVDNESNVVHYRRR